MNLRVNTSLDSLPQDRGIVYLLDIEVDGKQVTKIGMSKRLVEERVVEILTSYFKSYRYFPYCKPMKFTKTLDPLAKEQILLEYFKDYKYESLLRFGGCQEIVDVDVQLIKLAYKKVLADQPLPEIEELRKELDELQSDNGDREFSPRFRGKIAGLVKEERGGSGCITEGVLDDERMACDNDEKSEKGEGNKKASERTK